ncbi:MAG: nickel-dependent lactate racemase [Deltaproteobacteria bacterium]|nr:nickel-dependent lactate racemase [Deltaproteobacteria bacterium]
MKREFYLNYGEGKIHFSLPEGWDSEEIEEKRDFNVCKNPDQEVLKALDNPIKSKKLEELARYASEAVILFDDPQRLTPCKLIMPYLIERLNKGGIPDERIRLVCAVGTHPLATEEDMIRKLGEEIYVRFKGRIFSHDPFGEHVFIGLTKRGIPVEINKIVHESDLIVGIGTCMPHPTSGYGGGYKIVMPGVTSYKTTERHHMAFIRNRRSRVNVLEGNPFYEEIKEIGEMAGLSFKVDVVMDEKGNLIKAFAGHPYYEHQEASRYSGSVHEVTVSSLADITITSAHPLEIGVQATKALLLAQYVTKKGGTIIWVAPHKKAGSIGPLLEEMSKPISAGEYHRIFLDKGIPDHLRNLGVSYVMQIVHFKEISERYRIIHVTEGLNEEDVKKMGFVYAETLDDAILIAKELIPRGKAYILPSGGNILPKYPQT